MRQVNNRLHKLLPLVLIVLFFATPCMAQESPKWEVFGGYSFQRSDVRQYFKSSPIIYTFRGRYANLDGWDVSLTENMRPWLGGTLDIRGHSKSPQLLGTTNRERMYSILYGPRFFHRTTALGISITPFAHVLAGLARAEVRVVPVGPSASDNAFAIASGGGLDVGFGKRVGIRLFQGEYFRTNLLGTRPDSFRASAGVVFYLGKRD